MYIDLFEQIDKGKSDNSIVEKMRYYIWNLRNNYVSGNKNLNFYKKYFIRIIMDILMLDGYINYKNISEFSNRKSIDLYIDSYGDSLKNDELKMIIELINLDRIEDPELKKYIVIFSDKVNKILWKN